MNGRHKAVTMINSIMTILIVQSLILPILTGIGESEHPISEPMANDDLIKIDSDQDLTTENGVVSGSGTSENPYIIANLSIKHPLGSAISIINTSSHILVKNCTLVGGGGNQPPSLLLINVTNITLEDIRGMGENDCVWISQSIDILIKDSVINCSKRSLTVRDSSAVKVTGCWFDNGTKGIEFDNVDDSLVRTVKCSNFSVACAEFNGCEDILIEDDHFISGRGGGYP